MKQEADENLEKLIHQQLTKLPELTAPETLIPRVLETIRLNALKPWWQRSWFNWPFGARVISLAFTSCVLALTFTGIAYLWQDVATAALFETIPQWLARFSVVGEIINTLASAVFMVLNSINKLWLLLSLAIAFMMYVSCVGMGTVCFRLASTNVKK